MIYEYTCGSCGHQFDGHSSIAARDEPKKCPECGEENSVRTEIPSSTVVDTKGGFKMGAVTKSGQVIEGNFGRRPRKGKWYKP